jgi:phosphatidylserine/phosphatidylglycerophosphate/cardiolipin synthase-like enzyme
MAALLFTSPTLLLADGIKVYFNNPPEDSSGRGLDDEFIDFVNAAQTTIDAAFYELRLSNITEALIEAHRRGARVRMVADADFKDEAFYGQLSAAGIGVVFDDQVPDPNFSPSNGLMHDKFAIADGRWVWTGSYNLTDTDSYRNNNNVVVVESEALAAVYTSEFEEMFTGKIFGRRSSAGPTRASLDINGIRLEAYFSPEDDVSGLIRDEILKAKKSVYFCYYTFTDDAIGEALIRVGQREAEVAGVFESSQSEVNDVYYQLKDAGLSAAFDGNPYKMHHKFVVVDVNTQEARVITGSYNPTQSARVENDENVLFIRNPGIARLYYDEFRKVYGSSLVAPRAGDVLLSDVYLRPNPLTDSGYVAYKLSAPVERVEIRIYNVAGEVVREIKSAPATIGRNEVSWDGKNWAGKNMADGIYVIEVRASVGSRTVSEFYKAALLRGR